MTLVSLQCTQCGAQLPKQKQADTYQCSYCGSRFEASEPQPKAEPAPRAEVAAAAPKKGAISRLGSGLVFLLGLLPLLLGGLAFLRAMAPLVKGSVSGVRLGSPTRALWDRVGGPPVPVRIHEKEAVVGRMRLGGDQLYIVAIDSATARPLWKLGPLGTYGEGYHDTHFLIAAERVIVSDVHATLQVFELATGQQLKSTPLADRVTNLCLATPTTVAVAVRDRHHVALDLGNLTLSESTLPDDCSARPRPNRAGDGPDDGARVRKPAVRGFSISEAHADGELAVAAAVKSPGTPVPYAIGFVPATKEVRWQQQLPTVEPLSARATDYDALVGGRYLALYGVGTSGWRLTALDASDGARLWDVELRPLFAVDQIDGLRVTAQYAYVNRTSSLEIYDARSGKLVGTVGNETYR